MPKTHFEKVINGKKIKVDVTTHKTVTDDAWGCQSLCPWCGEPKRILGAPNPKEAARMYFRLIENHYNAYHRGK